MDDVKTSGLFRLVGLQVADQMPPNRQIRRLVHLRQRFLHFVFAEVDLAQVCGGAYEFRGKRLGDSDEAD